MSFVYTFHFEARRRRTCINLCVSSCSDSCMSTFTHFPAFFFSLQVKSFKLKWQAEHMNHHHHRPPTPAVNEIPKPRREATRENTRRGPICKRVHGGRTRGKNATQMFVLTEPVHQLIDPSCFLLFLHHAFVILSKSCLLASWLREIFQPFCTLKKEPRRGIFQDISSGKGGLIQKTNVSCFSVDAVTKRNQGHCQCRASQGLMPHTSARSFSAAKKKITAALYIMHSQPPLSGVTSALLSQPHVHFPACHGSVTQPPIARHRRLTWDQPPPANTQRTKKHHRLEGDGQTSVISFEVVSPDIICINAELLNELFTAEQEKTHTHTQSWQRSCSQMQTEYRLYWGGK